MRYLRAIFGQNPRRAILCLREAIDSQTASEVSEWWLKKAIDKFGADSDFQYQLAKYFRSVGQPEKALYSLVQIPLSDSMLKEFRLNAKNLPAKNLRPSEGKRCFDLGAAVFEKLGVENVVVQALDIRGFILHFPLVFRIEILNAAVESDRGIGFLKNVWVPALVDFAAEQLFSTDDENRDIQESLERTLTLVRGSNGLFDQELFLAWEKAVKAIWIIPHHSSEYQDDFVDKGALEEFIEKIEPKFERLRAVTDSVSQMLRPAKEPNLELDSNSNSRSGNALLVYSERALSGFLPGVISALENGGYQVRTFCLDVLENDYAAFSFFNRPSPYDFPETSNFQTLRRLIEESDLIWAEWAEKPAIFISNLTLSKKRVVRLHANEASVPRFLHSVDWGNVDQLIFVADHIRKLAYISGFGSGIENVPFRVIPNFRDESAFQKLKFTEAEYTLGLLQYDRFLKDPMYALEVIEKLNSIDSKFRLRLAGKDPLREGLECFPECERRYWEEFKELRDELIERGAVILDGFQADASEWFRGIGWILSTSLEEGTHEAIQEGIASGAIPVVRNWPRYRKFDAAFTQYPKALIHEDPTQAADLILREFNKSPSSEENKSFGSEADPELKLTSFLNSMSLDDD